MTSFHFSFNIGIVIGQITLDSLDTLLKHGGGGPTSQAPVKMTQPRNTQHSIWHRVSISNKYQFLFPFLQDDIKSQISYGNLPKNMASLHESQRSVCSPTSSFLPQLCDPLPETYKKVTAEVKDIFPFGKTHPFIGKRQFTDLIHEIPKGLLQGHLQFESQLPHPALHSTLGSSNPL